MDQLDYTDRKRRKTYEDRSDSYRHRSGGYRRDDYDRYSRGRGKRQNLWDGAFKSFKQYIEILNWEGQQPSKQEQEKAYEEYKSEYNHRNYRSFFDTHKDDEWFKDKYDPVRIKEWYPIKVESCLKEAEIFEKEYSKGTITINYSADAHVDLLPESVKLSNPANDPSSEGNDGGDVGIEEEGSTKEEVKDNLMEEVKNTNEEENKDAKAEKVDQKNGIEEDKEVSKIDIPSDDIEDPLSNVSHTLFIKTVSPQCSRKDLYDTLSQVSTGSIVKLLISDPNPNKSWHRIGWVTYSSVDAAKEALDKLSGTKMTGFELSLISHKEKLGDKKAKVTPPIASENDRIAKDLEQAKKLAEHLDKEKGIERKILLEETQKEATELLDLFIYYLRRVHFYCYYSSEECDTYDNLVMKASEMYLRGTEKYHSKGEPNAWAQTLDQRVNARLETNVSLERLTGKEAEEKLEEEIYSRSMNKVSDEDWRCTVLVPSLQGRACPKRFRAENFLRKHIKNKHPEVWEGLDNRVHEEQFFLNYLNDPKKVTPSSVAVQNMMQGGSSQGRYKKRDDEYSRRKNRPQKGRGQSFRSFNYVDLDEAPSESIEIDYSSQLAKFREKRMKNRNPDA